MIEMIAAYQRDGASSGVNLSCDKKCVVLTGSYWKSVLSEIKDSIVFIDEGEPFVTSVEFAKAIFVEGVGTIMEHPADFIESSTYYTWERFFTKLLTERTQGTYLQYNKSKLNDHYLHEKEIDAIMHVIPKIKWDD